MPWLRSSQHVMLVHTCAWEKRKGLSHTRHRPCSVVLIQAPLYPRFQKRDQRAGLRQVVCLLGFGRRWMPVCAQSLGHVRLFAAPLTVACQAPLSVGFPQQEYCNGLPFSPPRDLPDSGIERASLISSARAGRFFIIALPRKPSTAWLCTLTSKYQVFNTCKGLNQEYVKTEDHPVGRWEWACATLSTRLGHTFSPLISMRYRCVLLHFIHMETEAQRS